MLVNWSVGLQLHSRFANEVVPSVVVCTYSWQQSDSHTMSPSCWSWTGMKTIRLHCLIVEWFARAEPCHAIFRLVFVKLETQLYCLEDKITEFVSPDCMRGSAMVIKVRLSFGCDLQQLKVWLQIAHYLSADTHHKR